MKNVKIKKFKSESGSDENEIRLKQHAQNATNDLYPMT